MSNPNALPHVPLRFEILPHKSINMHKQRDKMFALPVHLLRQVFHGFHRFYRILIDLYGFHRFLGPEVGHGPGGLLTNSPLVLARLVRLQDLKSEA